MRRWALALLLVTLVACTVKTKTNPDDTTGEGEPVQQQAPSIGITDYVQEVITADGSLVIYCDTRAHNLVYVHLDGDGSDEMQVIPGGC